MVWSDAIAPALEDRVGADHRVDRPRRRPRSRRRRAPPRAPPARRPRRRRRRRPPSRRPRAPACDDARRRRSAPAPRAGASGSMSGVALHPDPGRGLARPGAGGAAEHARRARRRAPAGTSRASRCRASSASLAIAYRRPGSSSMRGNVSRSIDTVSRGGMRSQHRRLEHVRAGVDPVGRRLARAAASRRTPTTSPSARVGTTPNADGSSTS